MPESSAWSERRETLKQIRRFLVIGVLSVLIDLGVYVMLTRLGWGTHLAKGISYVAGMIFGFLGNKFWTFESARRSVAEPITYVLLYTTTLGVNVAVNAGALAVGTRWLTPRENKALAFLIATGVTTVLNFLGMRFITFFRGVQERRCRMEAAARVAMGSTGEDPPCN